MAEQANQNVTETEDGEESAKSPAYTPERIKELEANEQLATRLLSDPDIATLVNAKQTGKAFTLALRETPVQNGETEEAETETEETEESDDQVTKLTNVVKRLIKESQAPLAADLDVLKTMAKTLQNKEVSDQIKSVKDKFSDFPDYQEKMAKMSREHPGLNVQQLYVLAKSESGKLNLEVPSTDSEKPTAGPRQRSNQKKQPSHGRAQLANSLAEALEKLDLK